MFAQSYHATDYSLAQLQMGLIFFSFSNEVKAGGGTLTSISGRSDTLHLCATGSYRDRGRGTNWISVNLSPSGGKTQVCIFISALFSPDVTCISLILKLDC